MSHQIPIKIQMVDLYSQYLHLKDDIDAAMAEVIKTSSYINGPIVNEFAAELAVYNNINHVVPCANGTDALQLAMMALDLKPGDEVIVPSFTYVATAEVIALLGITPVFVDVDKDTFLINPELVEKHITPQTKAIVPVHLFGQCADMEAIMKIAHDHNLYVIEDTAQAIGAEYRFSNGSKKKAGTIGTIGTTSFFPSKNLGCFGDGGALLVEDDDLAERIRMIANHGQQVKYYHDIVGVNSRLDTLQAAVLKVKLKELNSFSERRNESACFYDEQLGNYTALSCPRRLPSSTHVFHQYTLICNSFDRDDLKQYLAERGIPTMVYYPVPLHLQKAYQMYGYSEGDFPISELLSSRVLSLPIHTEQNKEELYYITDAIKEFLTVKGLN
ncbi:DegT/DnrJ/EryC1/StrS family aminotransferase [Pontibacter akesuensis]|uniref:dTDP-4-amino-4,6-dideoxygalactose transaminase n=1 Tax=Pontibacter akesuensis TaxID=388950 RepID=A0A1I7GBC5_9BACT|nr:DegT/DnrJ/EryC1/StrS family aminotransferase [Pontibacter akesuensis]GHA57663.1 cell surface polysaccharide biosynthesis protein [Pontibacter akesuensis]SFU45748.1 dTDP-4-amino-4,6-dideoxygalactose transaminase [Pontibacter akesuensis]